MVEDIKFKQILLTGASGQLGCALLEHLEDYSGKVICLDIAEPVSGPAPNREFIQADFTSGAELEEYTDTLRDVDCLVHLASSILDSRDIKKDAIKSIDLNILGTLNLIKYLPGLKGICYASSYMVYGPIKNSPMNESHPTEPTNIYGAAKLSVENFVKLYGETNCVPAANLRFSGIYGPGTPVDSPRLIPSVIRTVVDNKPPVIYGTGTELREALYLADAVSAVEQALHALTRGTSGTYNISSGQPYSAKQLAEDVLELFAEVMGTKGPGPEYRQPPGSSDNNKPAGLTDMEIDISKAADELEFKPRFSMKEGLEKHMKWYNALGKTKEERR